MKWVAYKQDRNWVIQTCAMRDFLSTKSFASDVEAADAFARLRPADVIAAHADVPELTRAIAEGASSTGG
jgi:hypothetical protein